MIWLLLLAFQIADPALRISLPIKDLKASDIHDMFNDRRGGGTRPHEATDIMSPRGTPVHAVSDGKIVKLFLSKPGGNTIYEFDAAEKYCFYYAHLDHYAEGIAEGKQVHRGEIIAYVGSTGNADPSAPHLHIEIHELLPGKHWWQGTAVNPYPYLMDALKNGK